MRPIPTLVIAALCLAPAPLAAQGWNDVLPAAGPGCFARDYDSDHLARNPGQTVDSIRAVVTHSIVASRGDFPASWLNLVVAYSVKGRKEETWEFASCDSGPEGRDSPMPCKASCYGISYDFTVATSGRDAIRLDLSGSQLPSCHADGALEHPQNRVFVLRRVDPGQCAVTARRGKRP